MNLVLLERQNLSVHVIDHQCVDVQTVKVRRLGLADVQRTDWRIEAQMQGRDDAEEGNRVAFSAKKREVSGRFHSALPYLTSATRDGLWCPFPVDAPPAHSPVEGLHPFGATLARTRTRCQSGELRAFSRKQCICGDHESACPLLNQCGEDAIQVGFGAGLKDVDRLQPKGISRRLCLS